MRLTNVLLQVNRHRDCFQWMLHHRLNTLHGIRHGTDDLVNRRARVIFVAPQRRHPLWLIERRRMRDEMLRRRESRLRTQAPLNPQVEPTPLQFPATIPSPPIPPRMSTIQLPSRDPRINRSDQRSTLDTAMASNANSPIPQEQIAALTSPPFIISMFNNQPIAVDNPQPQPMPHPVTTEPPPSTSTAPPSESHSTLSNTDESMNDSTLFINCLQLLLSSPLYLFRLPPTSLQLLLHLTEPFQQLNRIRTLRCQISLLLRSQHHQEPPTN